MTEANSKRRNRYVVTNPLGQAVFQIGFPLEKVDYLRVYLNGNAIDAVDFVVDLAALEVILDVDAPQNSVVTVEGLRTIERTIDFPLRGELRTRRLNGDADANIQMIQELRRDMDRVLQLNKAAGDSVSGVIPLPVAGKGLKWNALGTALANTDDDVDGVLSSAQAFANAAQASQIAAAGNQAAAAASEAAAAASAARLYGTSSTSVLIGTGAKSFTTQAGKIFSGQQLIISNVSDATNYMHGNVTSYNATTGALVMNITNVGGTGTFSDWIISVSSPRGPVGPQGNTGPAGSGSGDMLRSNNLSDVMSASTSRANLGLGSIATQNSNGVTITGGTISGITDLAIADGGTGASSASAARTNLGLGNVANVDTTNASNITTGTLAIARVASGTPDGTKYVADDGTLKTPPSAVGTPGPYNVNAYCLLRNNTGSTINSGATAVGSGLLVCKFSSSGALVTGVTLAGTWQNMGTSCSANEYGLFQRIA